MSEVSFLAHYMSDVPEKKVDILWEDEGMNEATFSASYTCDSGAPSEDAMASRQASLDRIASEMKIHRENFIGKMLGIDIEQIRRTENWLNYYWPELKPRKSRWAKIVAALNHLKGYRLVHESEL